MKNKEPSFSFLIVTRNRPDELRFTLHKLDQLITHEHHEVLVFIDACPVTHVIKKEFPWVKWHSSEINLGASPARHLLYQQAVGKIWIGLDDDAHPISIDFLNLLASRFRESGTIGLIAFQEVRGLYPTDQDARNQSKTGVNYLTNDFVGCGFAVRKEAYQATNGFPVWIDIYGEEPAVALELLDEGWDILYAYDLQVNHRVDIVKRKQNGRNYFRFERQLKNTIKFYLVYHKRPIPKVLKTLFHNFRKYAVTDFTYLKLYGKTVMGTLVTFPKIWKYRKPVKGSTITKRNELKGIKY